MTDELELDHNAPMAAMAALQAGVSVCGEIKPATMSLKLAAGKGPEYPPGSGIAGQDFPREAELDRWIFGDPRRRR